MNSSDKRTGGAVAWGQVVSAVACRAWGWTWACAAVAGTCILIIIILKMNWYFGNTGGQRGYKKYVYWPRNRRENEVLRKCTMHTYWL
jgi:hypothetical protein